MTPIQDIPKLDNATLKKLAATLISMMNERTNKKDHPKARKKKFPLKQHEFKKSGNGYYNQLLTAVHAELKTRKLTI